MASFFSRFFKNYNKTLDRVTLTDANNTIYGSGVVWEVAAPAAARTLVVANCEEDADQNDGWKKYVIIKCKVDCSGFNITITDAAGTTLYTLSTNQAATELYVVLRLKDDQTWELA